MAALLKDASAFMILRYPLLSAVTLVKLCWELDQDYRSERYPQWYMFFMYFYIAVLFACGIVSFTSQRYQYANVTAASMTIMTMITVVTQSQQKSANAWKVVRVASHDVGVIGVFLIMASHSNENVGRGNNQLLGLFHNAVNVLAVLPAPLLALLPNPLGVLNVAVLEWFLNNANHAANPDRNDHLRSLHQYGKNLVSVFCIISAVQLYTVREEQQSFLHSCPNYQLAMAILGIVLLLGGFLLSSEWQTRYISGLMAVTLVCYLLTIDGNLQYWHFKLHIQYWKQMNMILSSATVVCALVFMAI